MKLPKPFKAFVLVDSDTNLPRIRTLSRFKPFAERQRIIQSDYLVELRCTPIPPKKRNRR